MAQVGDDNVSVIENVADKFLLYTNKNAPNGKVVLFDPQNPDEKNWKDVLPEKGEPLQNVTAAGGKMFATYLKNVMTQAYVYSLTGQLENEIALPGPGTAGGFGGNRDDKFVFYNFTSFTYPGTIFKYDIATKKSALFRAPQIDFKPADYETKQVFYPSKDGTKVPMFITHRKGIKFDASNPTLLYAYGGFNSSQVPAFSVMLLPFLEQGGVYALANIRGGNEYGEKYPATLITTADHDDRVVPAHSFKYAAALQEKNASSHPILIRIETKSGHGASNTTKAIEVMADIYAFIFHNLGVAPGYGEMTSSK